MSNPSDPTWGGDPYGGQQSPPPGWPTSPPPPTPGPSYGPGAGGPYGPPPQPGNPYGQSPYGGGYGGSPYGAPNPYGMGGGYPMPVDHPQGTTILILGILGIALCGLFGVAAFFMGNAAIKEIDANPGRYANRGTVQAGRIMGGIITALMVVGIVLVIVLVAVGATQGSSTN